MKTNAPALALETPRLQLRPFKDEDIPVFSAYRSDPEVARYQSWEAPFSLEKAARFVEEMRNARPAKPGEWYQVAIERKEDGALIGDCVFKVLVEDPRQAEVGFTLARAYQGQGYATEAVSRLMAYLFGELQLHRVHAICDAENLASARLLERLGMRREAHTIENIWFKGAWGSEFLYAILDREWREHRNPVS